MMGDAPVSADDRTAAEARAMVARPPFWERDIADVRADHRRESAEIRGEPEPVASVDEVAAGGVPARLYRPGGGDTGVLVWLHGGGFMVGDLETEDHLARALANRGGCAVLCVDYRLAPEHRYPAALDDAWAAVTWAAERFSLVAVGGDSAGGNLAAAVALQARAERVDLALQVLVYPMLDYRIGSPGYEAYRRAYNGFAGIEGFGDRSQEGIRRIWDLYADPSQRTVPSVSPLRAPSLVGVAPALIITAEHDILRAEAEEYGALLRQAGVEAEVVSYDGQMHGFYRALGRSDAGRDAVERSGAALQRALIG
jgi:acetyl esterase